MRREKRLHGETGGCRPCYIASSPSRAAPQAPTISGSGQMLRDTPSFSSSALTTWVFRNAARHHVRRLRQARDKSAADLPAMARWTPAAMSAFSRFFAVGDDLALGKNRAHGADFDASLRFERDRPQLVDRDLASGPWPPKRPVPAAPLSFIAKSATSPLGSRWMAFESCPPMSRIVRTCRVKKRAPLA